MKVYLESQPDYFNKHYAPEEYSRVLDRLAAASSSTRLCFTDKEGLTTAGKVYTIWQRFLGLFGFTNHTYEPKVESELLKFLLYGVSKNLITPNLSTFQKVIQRDLRVSEAVKKVFQLFNKEGRVSLEPLHASLQAFHRANSDFLTPALWRSVTAPSIERTHWEFGSVYLHLAEQLPREHARQDTAILEAYKAAAGLHNSLDPAYSNRLVQSFNNFDQSLNGWFRENSWGNTEKTQKAEFQLLCAKRAHLKKQMKDALSYFEEADKILKLSTPDILLYWADAAIQSNDYKKTETLLSRCAAQDLTPANHSLYANICAQLGAHFEGKKDSLKTTLFRVASFGLTPSPNDHCQKARNFYEKALSFTQDQADIQRRIVAVSKHIPPDETAWRKNYDLGLAAIRKAEWESAIGYLLVAMQSKERNSLLTDLDGQQTLKAFTQAIQKVTPKDTEKGLEFLEHALDCIGDITTLFDRDDENIYCHLDLVTEDRKFKVDVGAKLHRLKAEAMQTLGYPSGVISEEFALAVKLAEKNPFGIDALFMDDDKPRSEKDLKTYQELAAKWIA
jgi:tetratricopeptide (TPR) repeat protein